MHFQQHILLLIVYNCKCADHGLDFCKDKVSLDVSVAETPHASTDTEGMTTSVPGNSSGTFNLLLSSAFLSQSGHKHHHQTLCPGYQCLHR